MQRSLIEHHRFESKGGSLLRPTLPLLGGASFHPLLSGWCCRRPFFCGGEFSHTLLFWWWCFLPLPLWVVLPFSSALVGGAVSPLSLLRRDVFLPLPFGCWCFLFLLLWVVLLPSPAVTPNTSIANSTSTLVPLPSSGWRRSSFASRRQWPRVHSRGVPPPHHLHGHDERIEKVTDTPHKNVDLRFPRAFELCDYATRFWLGYWIYSSVQDHKELGDSTR